MRTNKKEFAAVITAAGKSTRMNTPIKKEYLDLPNAKPGVSILSECLYKFLNTNLFDIIIITVPEEDINKISEIIFSDKRISVNLENLQTKLIFVCGGAERRISVFNALLELEQIVKENKSELKYVLIHDGARPFLSESLIKKICIQVKEYGAVAPGYEATDTQKIVDSKGKITTHLIRSSVYAVQTPQGFDFKKLLQAHKKAELTQKIYTDDSEIYSEFEEPVFICEGEITNKKITFKEDLSVYQSTSLPDCRTLELIKTYFYHALRQIIRFRR